MDLKELDYIVTVANEGSISAQLKNCLWRSRA